jgi:hypothetical protein
VRFRITIKQLTLHERKLRNTSRTSGYLCFSVSRLFCECWYFDVYVGVLISLGFSCFLICSTTKTIFLGWVSSPQSQDRLSGFSYPMGNGGTLPRDSAAETWSWPPISIQCRGNEFVEQHIHSLTRLHGVVVNSLNTGTTLPLLLLLAQVIHVSSSKKITGEALHIQYKNSYFLYLPRRIW